MICVSDRYKVGIYLRLSREDEKLGESGSITNQRSILLDYIEKNDLEFIALFLMVVNYSNGFKI